MRFRTAAILIAAVSALAAGLGAPAGALADQPAASVSLKHCRTDAGWDPNDRSATFEGRMQTVPGAVRLSMHFRLITKSSTSTTSSSLGPWWHRDGAAEYTHDQIVNGMTPGYSYRVVVLFRWRDSSGKVIRHEKHTSRACRQPGSPNLTIGGVDAGKGRAGGTSVYRVHVANDGEGTARGVVVRLFVDGSLVDSRRIKRLPGGATRTVKITGPTCGIGDTLRAVVDPANRIQESNEQDNTFDRVC